MIKKVLIVDDNSTNLYMLETMLKGYGLEVTCAENGKVALDKARLNPPDLIVTDILMPVMDGYALCRQWKSDDKLKHIPLVFYTATYTEPKDEAFALSLGADHFILKPQDPDIFMNILEEVFGEKYTARQVMNKPLGEEMEFFRKHNEILFEKLEKKMSDLEIANHKLRASEELFRNYLEYAPDGVYTNEFNGTFLYCNRKCEEIIGYKREELIGKNFLELNILPEKSLNKALELLQENMKGNPTGPDEIELISKEGRLIPVEINTSVLQRSGEGIVLAFVRDITERRKLEEIKNQLALIVESADDAIIGKDLEGIIISWNNGAEVEYGYHSKEVIGKSISLLMPPGHSDEYKKILAKIAQSEKVNYPAHRAGHLKKLDEGDCIPLPPAPHSSPSTGRGILRRVS